MLPNIGVREADSLAAELVASLVALLAIPPGETTPVVLHVPNAQVSQAIASFTKCQQHSQLVFAIRALMSWRQASTEVHVKHHSKSNPWSELVCREAKRRGMHI
eukprot:14893866-Alexandrium_andersonii.AAC.1